MQHPLQSSLPHVSAIVALNLYVLELYVFVISIVFEAHFELKFFPFGSDASKNATRLCVLT